MSKRIFFGKTLLLLWMTCLVPLGCKHTGSSRPERVFREALEPVMINDPLLYHRLAEADTAWGIDPYALAAYRPMSQEEWQQRVEKLTEKVVRIRRKDPNSLNLSVLEYYLHSIRRRRPLERYVYPVAACSGVHKDLPLIFSKMNVSSKRQVEAYVQMLDEVEQHLGALIGDLEQRRKEGIIAPSHQLRQIREQCDSMVRLPMEQNPFFSPFARQLNRIGLMEPGIRSAYLDQCSARIIESVIPAYVRLSKYIAQLEETSVSVAGIWQYEQGDELYRKALYWYCGTMIDPDSLYPLAKLELFRTEKMLFTLGQGTERNMRNKQQTSALSVASMPAFRYVLPCDAHIEGLKLYMGQRQTHVVETTIIADHLATVQLLMDLGIHHKRWLREQAIRFVHDHTELDNSTVERIVDECIAHPGKMAAPKIGQLTILNLEKELLERTGPPFRAKEFISKLKANGPLPLDVLRRAVDVQ